MDVSTSNRLWWIDSIKALCMIGVYLCHTEVYYYSADSWSLGYWMKPFYVNAFFFVSGYLFFGKWLKNNVLMKTRGGYLIALQNVFFRLIFPTLIFSTLIYFPKTIFQGVNGQLTHYFFHVWGGISFWFTSALVVAQLILLSLVFLLKKKMIWVYLGVCALLFVLGLILNNLRLSNDAVCFFPWFYQTGLEYTFVMAIGGLYKQYEEKIDFFLNPFTLVSFILYVVILGGAWRYQIELHMLGLGGRLNLIGTVVILCGIIVLVGLCKRLAPSQWFSFAGKNSIVLYFFSGVIPAMLGAIAHRLIDDSYLVTLFLTILGIVCGSVAAFIVKSYLPFMVDLRILIKK